MSRETLAHVAIYLNQLSYQKQSWWYARGVLPFTDEELRQASQTSSRLFRDLASRAVLANEPSFAIHFLDAHLVLNPYEVGDCLDLIDILQKEGRSVQLAREVRFMSWMLTAHPETDELHKRKYLAAWEDLLAKVKNSGLELEDDLAQPEIGKHNGALKDWTAQFHFDGGFKIGKSMIEEFEQRMAAKLKTSIVQSTGKILQGAINIAQGPQPLMAEMIDCLSLALQEHYRAGGVQYLINGNPLELDDLFSVNGLLVILLSAIDAEATGRLFGFNWHCASDDNALAKVVPALTGQPDDLDSLIAIRDAIVNLVDGLEVHVRGEAKCCAVDGLYTDFYDRSLQGRVKFGTNHGTAYAESLRLYEAGIYEEALMLLNKVMDIRRGIMGAMHHHTLDCNKHIAACLASLNKVNQAVNVMEETVRLLTMEYGGTSEHVLQAEYSLFLLFSQNGNHARARELLNCALGKAMETSGPTDAVTRKLVQALQNLNATSTSSQEQSVVVCDESRFEARLMRETDTDHAKQLKVLAPVTAVKRLPAIAQSVFKEIERIGAEQPNFSKATDLILNTLHSQAITGRAAQLPPILLLGNPGVGKTRYIKRIATTLGLPFFDIQLAGVADGFKISGLSRSWGSAGSGAIANAYATCDVANPVFLLDEIDKTCRSAQTDALSVILLLLEKESSRSFMDGFLDVPLDASRASFIATANKAEELPDPLISRLHCIEIQPLTLEGRRTMVHTVYRELLVQEGLLGFLDTSLPEQTAEWLAGCGELGGREVKREVLLGMQRACRDFRIGDVPMIKQLLPEHLQLPDKQKRGMGFY